MHALVPPHPGPVAAAEAAGSRHRPDPAGRRPVAVVSWYFGVMLVSRFLGKRIHIDVPDALFGEINDGRDTEADTTDPGTGGTTTTQAPPRFGIVPGPAAAALSC